MLLISIHMPKTAGLSFRAALEGHFGPGFRHDYADYPLTHSPAQRQAMVATAQEVITPESVDGVQCIHGHFLPAKYLKLAEQVECRFVTWLRDPLQRLISHYNYWQRAYDPASELTSSLHRRVIEEGWTLEQFCLAPELRNVYSQFLAGFPSERLDFVGITEFFPDDLRYFSTGFLGNNLPELNVNRGVGGQTASAVSPELAELVAETHADDHRLYAEAAMARAQRDARTVMR